MSTTTTANTAPTSAPAPTEHDKEHLVSDHPEEEAAGLKRIVCIALEYSDHGRYAFDWALDNFIRPETDLVSLMS
jgi:hypothetical protein